MIPDGIWCCGRCQYEWSHRPAQTECPQCGALDNITWVNWPLVRAALLRQGPWPGTRGRKIGGQREKATAEPATPLSADPPSDLPSEPTAA